MKARALFVALAVALVAVGYLAGSHRGSGSASADGISSVGGQTYVTHSEDGDTVYIWSIKDGEVTRTVRYAATYAASKELSGLMPFPDDKAPFLKTTVFVPPEAPKAN
jgi:hypothetical protein